MGRHLRLQAKDCNTYMVLNTSSFRGHKFTDRLRERWWIYLQGRDRRKQWHNMPIWTAERCWTQQREEEEESVDLMTWRRLPGEAARACRSIKMHRPDLWFYKSVTNMHKHTNAVVIGSPETQNYSDPIPSLSLHPIAYAIMKEIDLILNINVARRTLKITQVSLDWCAT